MTTQPRGLRNNNPATSVTQMRQTGRERFLHLKTRQLFRRIRRHGPWLPGINQAAAELPPEIRMPDDCRLHQPMGTQNREQHIRLHFTRMPEMQVPTTYVPDVEDKTTMCAFAAAISQVENGVPAVMKDVEKDGSWL